MITLQDISFSYQSGGAAEKAKGEAAEAENCGGLRNFNLEIKKGGMPCPVRPLRLREDNGYTPYKRPYSALLCRQSFRFGTDGRERYRRNSAV